MGDVLRTVLGRLSSYIDQHKVLSDQELREKISEEVELLSKEELEELEGVLGGDVREVIYQGITEEGMGLSVFCPDLHVRLNYLGEIFFASPTHRYPARELHRGFIRMVRRRAGEMMAGIESCLSQFLEGLGYRLSPGAETTGEEYKRLEAQRESYHLLLYLFPSIVLIQEHMEEFPPLREEQVLVVPPERTPAPFINFLRNFEARVKEKGLLIWVADSERRSVSPVLGVPKDPLIWQHFTDPRPFIQAQQIWRGTDQFRSLD